MYCFCGVFLVVYSEPSFRHEWNQKAVVSVDIKAEIIKYVCPIVEKEKKKLQLSSGS